MQTLMFLMNNFFHRYKVGGVIACILICLVFGNGAYAQIPNRVDSATANLVIKQCEQRFPKFYREFQYISSHDSLIRQFVFFRSEVPGGSPAMAYPNGTVAIDLKFLEREQPTFDDNRLIVVLYHEIGHLHYFSFTPKSGRNIDNNEKFAFEYSLAKTKELAERGDCLPLKTGLKFMKLRSEGTNLADPHVRALKRMVNEPIYAEYLRYVTAKCG